jgi:hypothetical protein
MKLREVFDPLEPPPQGWARMKAQLDERRLPRWPWALAVAAAALLLAVAVWPRPRRATPAEVTDVMMRSAAALSFGLAPKGPTLAVIEGAAEPLPSSDPNVLLYRVAMVEAD